MDTKKLPGEIQRITQTNGPKHFSKELQAKAKAAVVAEEDGRRRLRLPTRSR